MVSPIQKPDLSKLDKSQLAAVLDESPQEAVIANAGSGKTTTMVSAIALYRYNNLNDKICAITFTRAAKDDMARKLANQGILDVDVTTIHVWSRNLLDIYGKRFGFKVSIIQEPQVKLILQALLEDYQNTHHDRASRTINPDVLAIYVGGAKNIDISGTWKRIFDYIADEYEHYKRSHELYDFGDYPLYLLDTVKKYKIPAIEGVDAMFVDEFQDVDPIQLELFKLVKSNKFFAIGDSKQAIYAFRTGTLKALDELTGFHRNTLDYNYRSYQEILDYAISVYINVSPNGGMISDQITEDDSGIICARGKGGTVYIVTPDNEFYILGKNPDGYKYYEADIAFQNFMLLKPRILCRTNKQVRAIKAMGYDDVSTVHQAKGLEYDNVVVVETEINSDEDLNIAYVALTRAKNAIFVADFSIVSGWLRQILHPSGFGTNLI